MAAVARKLEPQVEGAVVASPGHELLRLTRLQVQAHDGCIGRAQRQLTRVYGHARVGEEEEVLVALASLREQEVAPRRRAVRRVFDAVHGHQAKVRRQPLVEQPQQLGGRGDPQETGALAAIAGASLAPAAARASLAPPAVARASLAPAAIAGASLAPAVAGASLAPAAARASLAPAAARASLAPAAAARASLAAAAIARASRVPAGGVDGSLAPALADEGR